MSSEQVRDVPGNASLLVEMEELYGAVAASEFGAMYASRVNPVVEKIAEMESAIRTHPAMFEEQARWAIGDSARMNSFRGNFEDVHVLATVAHSISNRWATEQGKNLRCSLHSLYARAWRQSAAENGHHGMAEPPTECLCNLEES